MVFEHNPLNPLTRLAVSRCEFDADAVLLSRHRLKELFIDSGVSPVEGRYILFLPFRGSLFARSERVFRWLPLGAQYYIAGTKQSLAFSTRKAKIS